MKYRLEELVDLKIGRTPPRKEQQWFNQGSDDWKWVSIKDMGVSGRYISETSETISKEAQTKFNIPIVRKGTVILSFKLTVGRVAIVDEDMLTNEAIAQLPINDTNIVRPLYLYYLLKNYKFDQLGSTSSIATAVNSSYLKKMEIEIPDIHEQDRVISILQSLDNELELNREINDNLLQQAQAIYDEICKDCEPIKLESLISVIETGSRPKGGAESEGIPSIGAEKIERFGTYDFSGEKYISEEFFSKLKRGIVLSGDVLLYKDGAYTGKSSMALDGFPHEKCAVNEHVFILRTRDNFAQYFLYFTLSSPSIREKIYTLACGKAAQPGLNQQELFSVEAPIPPDDVLQDFDKQVDPLMHAIALNALENLKLSNLRDSLLPKLMSGEIDVDSLDL